jgi:hypothetical protein
MVRTDDIDLDERVNDLEGTLDVLTGLVQVRFGALAEVENELEVVVQAAEILDVDSAETSARVQQLEVDNAAMRAEIVRLSRTLDSVLESIRRHYS